MVAHRAMGPASLAVHQAVIAAWVDRPDGVLVGCSGGPDSLALAVISARAGERASGAVVTAVIIDHQLQPGSAHVAASVREQLTAAGVDAVVVPVEVGTDGGPEAAARDARYDALRAAAAQHRAGTVLLGHTLDDQAETVLLGLARGSGVRSLAGMPPVRGIFVRPLLGLRRSVTVAACAELGLQPWTDPHNTDPTYARVRVRGRVLPRLERELGPGVAEALARTADLARDDADLLDELAATAYPGVLVEEALDCAALSALAPAVRRRVLRRYLSEQGAREVSAAHLSAVAVLLDRWRGQRGVDLPGLRVVRERGRLRAVAG